MQAQAWMSRPGYASTVLAGVHLGTETKLAGWGQKLSWNKSWHRLNWTRAIPDDLPILGNGIISLDSGPSSGLDEDKAGLLPQRDRAEPLGHE